MEERCQVTNVNCGSPDSSAVGFVALPALGETLVVMMAEERDTLTPESFITMAAKASRRFVLKRVERQGDLYNQDTVACRVREVLGGIVAGQKRWYRGCTEVEDCRVRSVGGWPRINEEEAAVTWKCSTVKWHVKSEGTYDSRYNV